MALVIVLSFFVFFFWLFNRKKSRRELANYIAIIGISTLWCMYFLVDSSITFNKYISIALIIFFIGYAVVITRILTPPKLEVVATQDSYFGIKPSIISNFFTYRMDIKKKRIDVNVNPLEKVWIRKYSNNEQYLTANFFLEYENLKLTKISNIDEIKQYPFHSNIFLKLQDIIAEKEIKLDFNKILQQNNHIVEYLLMELWESYTQDINFGISTLNVLASSDMERQLIGALDNLMLNSIKRNGAALYYSYMQFKDKIPQFVEINQDSNLNENGYEDF